MTPPTTDTSREAVEAFIDRCWLIDPRPDRTETMLRALLAERDALRKEAEELILSDDGAMMIVTNQRAEILALRDQLAAARNEARKIARNAITLMLEGIRKAALDTELGHSVIDDVFYPSIDAYIDRALKSTTPAPRCDICGDSGSVATSDIDHNGEHIEIVCPECSASSPHQIDRLSLADIEGYGTNSAPAPREVTVQEAARVSPIADLLPDATARAEKAMNKFPQPNYIISKWAEESGEVTKALIHAAEGRETWENIRGELVDTLAMLHRLFVEGDEVHGLPPLRALAQKEQSDV